MRFVEIIGLVCLAGTSFASQPYGQMYVFGDSYSDTGAGYLDGNGPTAVAYFAKHMGIELKPSSQQGDVGQSLNFAVSGAQTGESQGNRIGTALLGFGMKNQVREFSSRVKSGKIQFDAQKTLFFFAGGLNDAQLTTETTMDNLKNEIKEIYALGGRHFMVALLPIAIPGFSNVTVRLNRSLRLIPEQMQAGLRGATIALSHWGMYFDEVLGNPGKYGITDTVHACAGRAIFHQDATPCAKPDSHFYYHAEHPSTATHRAVGEMMYGEMR